MQVHQSCRMVNNRISGRRSRDLAIQSECVKFQQSDGGGTIKLNSNGCSNRSDRVVRNEGVLNYWLIGVLGGKDSLGRWMSRNDTSGYG